MKLLFLVLVAATAAARLVELVICRRNLRADPVAERIYPAMVAVHTILLVGAPLEVVLLRRPFTAAIGLPALILFVGALGLRAWTVASLGRHWNVRVAPPLQVIDRGPYRFIRHPNYLVVIVELLTLPLIHGAYLTALGCSLANALVLRARIRTEEQLLLALPAYRETMGPKPRFIPRWWRPLRVGQRPMGEVRLREEDHDVAYPLAGKPAPVADNRPRTDGSGRGDHGLLELADGSAGCTRGLLRGGAQHRGRVPDSARRRHPHRGME